MEGNKQRGPCVVDAGDPVECLEKRIVELAHERDQYEKRRKEAQKICEAYRAECLAWRDWLSGLMEDFDGVDGSIDDHDDPYVMHSWSWLLDYRPPPKKAKW